MSFPEALMRRRRVRQPMDERLPDGRSVDDLVREQLRPQLDYRRGVDDVRVLPSGRVEPRDSSPLSFRDTLTRPRIAAPVSDQQIAAENSLTNQGFKGAMMRERRTQPRDYVADDSAYLRDAMKQPRTWRDKLIDVADVVNAVAGGKPRVLKSKRERAIAQAEGQLATDLELQKQALSQMVPVELDNGQTVMVPARQAGTLSSQQQRIRQQNESLSERKAVNENRKRHWDAMDARDRKRLIVSLYNTGGLNDPEMLEYAADQLGLPGNLREKFVSGQMRDAIDENGNIIQVNRQTNEVTETGRKSYETTKEAGRERRALAAQQGANYRAGLRGTGARTGTGMSQAQLKAANALAAKYNYTRKAEMSSDIPPNQKPEIQRQREALWQQIMDTYPGMFEADEKTFELRPKAGSPAQPSGQYTGRRISRANVAEYGRRHGMTAEQAAEYLSKEGATIY